MGLIAMSERDLQRIEVLSKVTAGRMTMVSASHVLDVSTRQVRRMLKQRSTICRELRRNFWQDREVPIAEGYWHVTAHGMSSDRRRRHGCRGRSQAVRPLGTRSYPVWQGVPESQCDIAGRTGALADLIQGSTRNVFDQQLVRTRHQHPELYAKLSFSFDN